MIDLTWRKYTWALSQFAAIEAFGTEARIELNGHMSRYAANRELLLNELPDFGITKRAPADEAFYVYADIAHLLGGETSTAWCSRLLHDTGLALAPGIDFDTVHGDETVRLSFVGSTADITAALDRLAGWLPLS